MVEKREMIARKINRVVIWFSCGITSAMAGYIYLKDYNKNIPLEIIYCDTKSEHPDNKRFMKDCENLYQREIKIMTNDKYDNIRDLFRKDKAIVFRTGAPCTLKMKKAVRQKYEDWNDLQIFGFDYSEIERAKRLLYYNNEIFCKFPLIAKKLYKSF